MKGADEDGALLPRGPAAQPERQAQQERAEDHRIRSDQPRDGYGAGARYQHRQQPEHDRQEAVQPQPGFTLDPAAEPDGRDDFGDPADDRPHGDHVQQGQFGQTGEHERDDPGRNADESPTSGAHDGWACPRPRTAAMTLRTPSTSA
jgi:hypothetical protein